MPVTMPDEEPIEAVVSGVMLQIPPPVPLLKLSVAPVQTCVVPVIAPGAVVTVTITFAEQPVGNV